MTCFANQFVIAFLFAISRLIWIDKKLILELEES